MINKKVFVLGFLIFIIIGVSPINAETDDIPIKSKMNNSKDYSDNKTVFEIKTVKNVKKIGTKNKKQSLKPKSGEKKKINKKKKIVNKNKLTKLVNKKLVDNKEELRKAEELRKDESIKLTDYRLGILWKSTVALTVLTFALQAYFILGGVKAPVVK